MSERNKSQQILCKLGTTLHVYVVYVYCLLWHQPCSQAQAWEQDYYGILSTGLSLNIGWLVMHSLYLNHLRELAGGISCTNILLTTHMWPAVITLNYSVSAMWNDVRQIIYMYNNNK